jgi:hypothetical protein
LQPRKRLLHRLSETTEIVVDNPPNYRRVDVIVGMTQYVPEAADVLPWLIGRERLSLAPQSAGSLANDQQCVQNRIKCLLVSG